VINEVRHKNGLPLLRVDPVLQRAARSHSADMLRRDYFDHGAFGQRLTRFGVRARMMGENIAWWPDAKAELRAVVQMWLGSPGHRANLLRAGFRRVGVAAPAGTFQGTKVRMITADFAGR
jgi:uncharacterized protein YkwD